MKGMVFLVIWASSMVFAAAPSDPVALVREKDKELQALLRKNTRSEKETEKIKFLINDIFDFEALAKKSLPSSTWKALSDAERADFVREFRRMVENSSVKRLEVYRSDSARYEPAVIKNNEAKVTAHVWYKGKESILVYRFDQVNGQWKAWDLVIDDLSTARNYREQFAKILETKTFAELLNIIKSKADEAAK